MLQAKYLLLLFIALNPVFQTYSMKRSVSDTGTSDSTSVTATQPTNSSETTAPTLDTSIFQNLNRDLLPTILSYCQMRKSDLILVSTQMYHYFCFKNHFIPDHEAPESWKKMVELHPESIVAHPRDCQHIYYLLIQEDNTELMKILLEADKKGCSENMDQISVLKNRPEEEDTCISAIKSNAMKNLIYEYTNIEDLYYTKKQDAHYTLDKKIEFIHILMNNDIQALQQFVQNTNQETVRHLIEDNTWGIIDYTSVAFFKELMRHILDDTKYINSLFYDGLGHHNKIEALFELGINPNTTASYHLVSSAVRRASHHNDYSLLHILGQHGANFDIYYDISEAKTPLDIIHRSLEMCDLRETQVIALKTAFNVNEVGEIIGGQISSLLYAVLKENPQLVTTLLHYKANPYASQSFRILEVTYEYDTQEVDTEISIEEVETDLLSIATALDNQDIITAITKAREKFDAKISETSDALLAREPEADSSASNEVSQESEQNNVIQENNTTNFDVQAFERSLDTLWQ